MNERNSPRKPGPHLYSSQDELDSVKIQMTSLGLEVGTKTQQAAQNLISPVPLAALAGPYTCGQAVGAAWKAALDKKLANDSAAVLVLLLVGRAIELQPQAAEASLRSVNMHATGTLLEVRLRLAGSLYSCAKEAFASGEYNHGRALAQRILNEGQQVKGALARVRLPTAKLKLFHGMQGVSALWLARTHESPFALLHAADEDLALAHTNGDTSAEHFNYHVEVLVRKMDVILGTRNAPVAAEVGEQEDAPDLALFDQLGEQAEGSALVGETREEVSSLIVRAIGYIESARVLGFEDRALIASRGDIEFRRALLLIGEPEAGHSEAFRASLEHYIRAGTRPSTSARPDAILALNRGQARLRVLADIRKEGSAEEDLEARLDEIVSDLNQGAGHAPFVSYPVALLERARMRLWRTDVAGSQRDVDNALRYMSDVIWIEKVLQAPYSMQSYRVITDHAFKGSVVRRLLRRVEVLMLEAGLRSALEKRSIAALKKLLLAALAVDDEPIHGGVLAHAARVLATDAPETTEPSLLMEVSVRLEMQMNKVQRSHRRSFLASHSASLAVLAMRGREDLEELSRIHRLYSQAVEEASTLNAILLRHNGVAAMRVGKVLANGAETDRDAAEDLFREAAGLLIRALTEDAEAGAAADASSSRENLDSAYEEHLQLEPDELDPAEIEIEDRRITRGTTLTDEGAVLQPGSTLTDIGSYLQIGIDPENIAWLQVGDAAAPNLRRAGLESRLGEIHMRLYTLAGKDEDATNALSHFQASVASGNTSHHLVGLVADVYYRRGQANRSSADLATALMLKSQARERGGEARENWSVSANAYAILFATSRDIRFLAGAIVCAAFAAKADPNWAWPLFQLAELSSEVAATRSKAAALVQDYSDKIQTVPATAFRALKGEQETLLEEASAALVRSREFERIGLGGRKRQGESTEAVYALADPHALLSSTVVVKEGAASVVGSEAQALIALRRWLSQHKETWLHVPKVVSLTELTARDQVEPHSRRSALVMQRERGRPVGSLFLEAAYSEKLLSLSERILKGLALYHEWRGAAPAGAQTAVLKAEEERTLRYLEELGWDGPPSIIHDLWAPAYQLPFLGKKDAHANNWLVPDSGSASWIAMIDLESESWLPCLLEAVQLLEDFPVLPLDTTGWQQRLQLMEHYLSCLPPSLVPASTQTDAKSLRQIYESFALTRAVFLLKYLSKKSKTDGSVINTSARTQHGVQLLRALTASPTLAVSTLSTSLLSILPSS